MVVVDNIGILALSTFVVLVSKESPVVKTIARIGGIAYILWALVAVGRFLLKSG